MDGLVGEVGGVGNLTLIKSLECHMLTLWRRSLQSGSVTERVASYVSVQCFPSLLTLREASLCTEPGAEGRGRK